VFKTVKHVIVIKFSRQILKRHDVLAVLTVIEGNIEELEDRVCLEILRAGMFLKYSPFL